MKAIVFNLLEEVVVQHYGEDTWDLLLDATKLDGSYTSLGSYPDEHVAALVEAAATALVLTQFYVLRWFGNKAMPLLLDRYPSCFAIAGSANNASALEYPTRVPYAWGLI